MEAGLFWSLYVQGHGQCLDCYSLSIRVCWMNCLENTVHSLIFFFFFQMMGGERICRGNMVFCFVLFFSSLGLKYHYYFRLLLLYVLCSFGDICVCVYIYIYTLIWSICFPLSDLLRSVWQTLEENRCVDTVREGEGEMNWEIRLDIYRLSCEK